MPGHDLNEHLCLDACRRLGLLAVRSRVQDFGDERAIVIERYDRATAPDGSTQVRIHQEDLCQALGVRPSGKYQSDGGPGGADVIALLRQVVDAEHVDRDVDRFVDALILNWLLAAPDAHAKNYSLLLSGGSVRLAPLYDIASALPYDDTHAPKVKLAMKIGPYYRVSAIGTSAWTRLAADLDLDPDTLVDRARSLAADLPDALASAIVASAPDDAFAATLLDAVVDHVASCRAALA
jgi:serine/threonine-protein kinase HipA